ncbi:sulfite exporter TauE/SafE family protein [Halomonas sp. GD1P12]|uniref:sulfite exporter TauE/SafE family protein n=1 Tax=Halomonas sp. GD1P12 TaxID=2982691 RepID=UPI0021E43206|nr:sulfite exporter TauE/SafE family protein [Halomonas sp. GD1P12]UYG01603.1 sulfite exporter TauE/SafE family protein [Halomonas sp. GD1P12]
MIVAFLTLLAAGVVKGAIGSGVPVIVVPIFTMLYNVRVAIALLVVSNLCSNALQVWQYRRHLLPWRFLATFSIAGCAGIVVGTWGLVALSHDTLSLGVAGAIVLYLIIKLLRRKMALSMAWAQRLVLPVGLVGGVLQGAAGMSAPASITFLNAMQLERRVFIGSISVFFCAITVAQIPALLAAGLLNVELTLYSAAAFGVIALGMPLGAALGKRLPYVWFDNLIVLLLASIAVKIITDVFL